MTFSTIPINWRNKRPALPAWEEYQTRLPTPEEIETWKKNDPKAWANILGRVSGDVYVVDVDSPSAELTVVGRWMKHLGPTYTVVSSGQTPDDPTSGKRHYYFKDTSGVRLARKKYQIEKVSTDARVCHVDLQGEGAYVLAPGSMHPSGSIYTVVDTSDIKEVSYEKVTRILKLLLKHWPLVETVAGHYPVGSRHYVALAFGGYLLHHGFNQEDALILGRTLGFAAIDPASGEEDIVKIEDAINQTFDRDREGIQVGYKAKDVGDIGWSEELIEAVEKLPHKVQFSTAKEDQAEEQFRKRMGLVEDGIPKTVPESKGPVEEAAPRPAAPTVVLKTPKDEDDEETPTVVIRPEELVIEPCYQEGYERKIDPAFYQQTDSGNAEQMYARFGSYIRWMPEIGFVIWSGQRWIPNPGDTTVMKLAMYSARLMVRDMDPGMEKTERKMMIKHAISSESRAGIKGCLDLLRMLVVSEINNFDRDPWLFNVQNGTIDLRTGRIKPHDRNDLITSLTPVVYDKEADCLRWKKFQEEIERDPEVRRWKQQFFGYSMTGDTRERVFGIAIGESGSNGKSTEKETLLHIFGDYAAVTSFHVISADSSDDRIRNELARMKGKRFVVASEGDEKTVLAEAVVKEITGRDTIRARLLYKSAFEFVPQLKIWLITNSPPTIKATTNPIWDRVMAVEYTETFLGKDMDRLLGQKLQAEASGILNWLVKGCLEWQKAGLPRVASMEKFKHRYRQQNDSILEFIETMCEPSLNGVISYSDFVAQYNMWATRERKFVFNSGKAIGQHVKLARGTDGQPYIVPAEDGHGQRIYRGIQFKTFGSSVPAPASQTITEDRRSPEVAVVPSVQERTIESSESSKIVCRPPSSVPPSHMEGNDVSLDDNVQSPMTVQETNSHETKSGVGPSVSSVPTQATLEQAVPELAPMIEALDTLRRAVVEQKGRTTRRSKNPTAAREEVVSKLIESANIFLARSVEVGETSWPIAELEATLMGLYRVPPDADIKVAEVIEKLTRIVREGDNYVYR